MVITSNNLQTTVETAMNYVKTFENNVDSQKAASRNVLAIEQGGQGRGCGGGRGGRGGRGRGGDSGWGRGKGKSAYDPNKKNYPPAEWRSLTAKEQQKVRDARASVKAGEKCSVASTVTFEDNSKRQKQDEPGVGASMTRRKRRNEARCLA
jgi:hypothetical protein